MCFDVPKPGKGGQRFPGYCQKQISIKEGMCTRLPGLITSVCVMAFRETNLIHLVYHNINKISIKSKVWQMILALKIINVHISEFQDIHLLQDLIIFSIKKVDESVFL